MRANRNLVAARDAGLARARSWTKGLLVAGVAVAGVCTAAVAHALPGHGTSHPTLPPVPATGPSQPTGGSDPGQTGPAPTLPPAPVQQAPVTTSGGS